MNGKMPVSALQELVAARGHPMPRYQEEGFGTQFKCTVYVEGITAVGHGSTKKNAKHDSAKNALEKLQSSMEIKEAVPIEQPLRNYVGELNEYSSKHGLSYPEYQFVTALVGGEFVFKCNFIGNEVQGIGMNKKDAKQISAKNMIKLIGNGNDNNNISEYKLINQKPSLVTEDDTDHIIEMFNKLSASQREARGQSNTSSDSSPEDSIEEEIVEKLENQTEDLQSVESLEQQLKKLEIEFTLKDFQKNPYVASLVIKNTNLTFMATGKTKEEALIKVYNDVIICKKIGCLNPDIISLEQKI